MQACRWRIGYICRRTGRAIADVGATKGLLTKLGWNYVGGIQSHTTVWAPGTGPRPPKKWSGRGRPPKLMRRDDKHHPTSVKELALGLPERAWRKITWRAGQAERLSSRFAR